MKTFALSLLIQLTLIPTLLTSQWQLRYPLVPPSSITDIVFVSDRVGFCSTLDAAIYKTTDKGVTWAEVVRKKRERIHSIVFSDTLNGVAILPHGYIGDQLNILQTSDGGTTWTERFIGPFNEFGISQRTNTLFSVRPGLWLMSSYTGEIRVSTDLVNWKKSFNFKIFVPDDVGMPVAVTTSFVKLQNNHMLALSNKYDFQRYTGITDSVSLILTSDTSCAHWDTLWIGADVPLYSMCFADTMNGWAVGEQGTIMKTTNGGLNWNRIYRDSSITLKYVTAVDSLRIYALADQNKILNSTDGGKTWNGKSVNTSFFFPKAVFLDKDIGFLTANSGLPLKTVDGGITWNEQGKNIEGSIRKVNFVSVTTGWVLASGRVFKSLDGGITWQVQDSIKLSNIISLEMIDSLNGWAMGNKTAYRTSDGGITWNIGFSDSSISSYRGINFYDRRLGVISEARQNNNDALNYVTIDSGRTWTAYKMPESVSSYSKVQFSDYQHGWLIEQGGVWNTLDTGKTWKKIYSDSTYYIPWGFDFIDSLHGWYVSNKVRFTTDGGKTWNSSPLPYYDQIEDLHFISLQNGYAVGYDGSIFSTTDGGWTWQSDFHRSSVPLFSISEVHYNDVSHLWVGGDSFVIEYTNTAKTHIGTEKLLPTELSLNQNYPNPFNPITTISFSLPHGNLIRLMVYDYLGREIVTLVNEYRSAGNCKVLFDATTLSSGVYFYRILAGDYSATKKMILIK